MQTGGNRSALCSCGEESPNFTAALPRRTVAGNPCRPRGQRCEQRRFCRKRRSILKSSLRARPAIYFRINFCGNAKGETAKSLPESKADLWPLDR